MTEWDRLNSTPSIVAGSCKVAASCCHSSTFRDSLRWPRESAGRHGWIDYLDSLNRRTGMDRMLDGDGFISDAGLNVKHAAKQ
jgi:hypothetical protein